MITQHETNHREMVKSAVEMVRRGINHTKLRMRCVELAVEAGSKDLPAIRSVADGILAYVLEGVKPEDLDAKLKTIFSQEPIFP